MKVCTRRLSLLLAFILLKVNKSILRAWVPIIISLQFSWIKYCLGINTLETLQHKQIQIFLNK